MGCLVEDMVGDRYEIWRVIDARSHVYLLFFCYAYFRTSELIECLTFEAIRQEQPYSVEVSSNVLLLMVPMPISHVCSLPCSSFARQLQKQAPKQAQASKEVPLCATCRLQRTGSFDDNNSAW